MRKALTTAGKALSGRGCPAFSRRWCICRLERDGAGCSILCIRIPIGDKENNCKQTLQSVQAKGSPYLFAYESAKLPSEMSKLQKWWKPALVIVMLVIVLQAGVSILARTHRVHTYLAAQLERAFGRQVDVVSFDARI